MNSISSTFASLAVSSILLSVIACGGGSSDNNGGGGDNVADAGRTGGKSLGEGPCESPSECTGDVCVGLIDGQNPPIYCTQICDDDCPSGFYCDRDTFSLIDLSFCRFGNTPSEPPPPPPEPPRLPCSDDSQCQSGLVCATYMGARDCTLQCNTEDDCNREGLGVSFDLMNCAEDQNPSEDRLVCLPDPACFPDASSCIALPF